MKYLHILPLFISLLVACAMQPPSIDIDAPLGCLATPARLATPTFAPTAPPIPTQVTSDRIAAGTASALPTPPACNELACAYATFARGQQILALDAASNTY